MSKTRHIQARMSQRGIKEEMVNLAMQFGMPTKDKHILNQQTARALIAELEKLKRTAQKIVDKGGLVVVSVDGVLVTTYDLDSYTRQAS